MDRDGFRELLRERGIPDDQLESHVALAERFELRAGAQAAADDVRAYAATMVEEGLNTWDNFVTLARYGRFTQSDAVYVAAIELIDGAEAMDTLYEKLEKAIGAKRRDDIFAGIEIPQLGTPNAARPEITRLVMDRLERMVDAETCRQVLSSGLRYLEDEWYLDQRAKYAECAGIDEYLERKGDDFVAELEKIRDEGGLYFTQPVTDEVIAYVQGHPEIRQGVREGSVLFEAKIPYMTVEYLAATDERAKRFYYCHCPWVRESLKAGDAAISPTFCLCSAGFHKKSWEVIFERPLRADVVESMLNGDPWCKIAVHLPEEALGAAGS